LALNVYKPKKQVPLLKPFSKSIQGLPKIMKRKDKFRNAKMLEKIRTMTKILVKMIQDEFPDDFDLSVIIFC
jgi:hypothetical protein